MSSSSRVFALLIVATLIGCSHNAAITKTGDKLDRKGDEIVIAGQLFHTGAPVITWMDEGGYDAYRTERRFSAWDDADYEKTTAQVKGITSPNRYNIRFTPTTKPYGSPGQQLTPEQLEKVRGGGWPLSLAQEKVDQFVYHYDVAAVSRNCFKTLHDARGLSVHFMLDLDGTIYQTLDVKERAWHATSSNNRSVGIEIANIGAYGLNSPTLAEWYRKDADGHVRMVFPAWLKNTGIRTPNFIPRPARAEKVVGELQGRQMEMYDLTPQQYDSLIKLTATLCMHLPKLKCDYPRDEKGRLITHTLPDDQLEKYQGLMGHYHVQTNKQDPGPAFQWDRITNGARKLMGLKALPAGDPYEQEKPMLAEAKK